jgi:hypothetical protein
VLILGSGNRHRSRGFFFGFSDQFIQVANHTLSLLPYLLTNKQKNQGFLSKFCHDFDKKVDGVVIEQERY